MNEQQKTALITGASSGIGFELAKLFAQDGYRLLLVAKEEMKLAACAEELRDEYAVEAISLPIDLSQPGAGLDLAEQAAAYGPIDALVNDAGLGRWGLFYQTDLDKHREVIAVNVAALVELTWKILPRMIERGSGKILNLASVAGTQPGPMMAVYNATKSFVLSFSLAIGEELADTGVTVTALCPGPTETDFEETAGMEGVRAFQGSMPMTADKVAETGYKAMVDGDRVVVAGLRNKMMVELERMLPERLVTKMSKAMMSKA
jgi:short-subunit dehydrogenase